jgi:hypothetical protein
MGSNQLELLKEVTLNEKLEELVHKQRLQLLFAHSAWLDQRERNLRLREYVLELQSQLDRAGVDYAPLPPPSEHPMFPFMLEDSARA